MYIINMIKIGHTFCERTIIKQDELLQLLENNSTNKHKTAALVETNHLVLSDKLDAYRKTPFNSIRKNVN